jgi:hypothetical protein
MLEAEKVLTPVHYWNSKGVKRPNRAKLDNDPHKWNSSTIVSIPSFKA